MRSSLPKVLHRIAGKPMLVRVLDSLDGAGFSHPHVVVGFGADQIKDVVGDRCGYIEQGAQLGTGHAAGVALQALPETVERVLLIHGDEPLIEPEVYSQMLALQQSSGAPIVLLTSNVDETRGFGRVIRDEEGAPIALLQEEELAPEHRSVREINLGAYVFDASFLRRHLPQLQPHPPKGEYYLTDVIGRAVGEGQRVEALVVPNGSDIMGINDLVQLEQASHAVYQATNRRLMLSGVTIVDSASTFIDEEVCIEPDTVIHPFTIISGRVAIGRDCTIGPNAHISESRIGDRCRIIASTVEGAAVSDEVSIGPYAHLRPGAEVGRGAEIGNYAEIKRSTVGAGSKMHHFSYLGDAEVGSNVNIGAGTITCNFDGVAKHRTTIEDEAFIGSDTMLRAPITVGKGAVTGAGSVVIRDVPPRSVVAGVPARAIKQAEESPMECRDADPEEKQA